MGAGLTTYRIRLRAIALGLAVGGIGQPAALAQQRTEQPWHAHEALRMPDWLRFGLEHRTRLEHLHNDFRSSSARDSRALVLRTLFSAEVRLATASVGLELQDSRAFATHDTPLNTTIVNPVELLQAYGRLHHRGLVTHGDEVSLKLGRMTMDLGSRRLVARNDFRNTINAFTGADLAWTSPQQHLLRALVVMPVRRLPTDGSALGDNRIELDRENTDAVLGGVFFGSAPLWERLQLESYMLGFRERDGSDTPSSNRRLVTPGFRVHRAPAPGSLDLQAEIMLQLGTSRASSAPSDTTDLSHRAAAAHFSAGYSFRSPWHPHTALLYDYASGDREPHDRVNGRFDPLFAARRFEFGPTSLYGAISRSNISSPGVRLEVVPHPKLDAFGGYRLVWLASARDLWTTAAVREPGGFVGQQLEGRVRWHVFRRTVTVDVGAAYLVRSGAAPVFVYGQVTGRI